jgi:hypothetical protein
MKVKIKIGPYIPWIGPYQIAEKLEHLGVSHDRCHDIGSWISDHTWLQEICEWIYNKRKRTVKIKIDGYDVWNLDHTLALIIAPCLKKLQEHRCGTPFVAKVDLPEDLREEPDYSRKAWEWVMGEMIWTFEAMDDDNVDDWDDDISKRMDNGLRLFAKYYRALWD